MVALWAGQGALGDRWIAHSPGIRATGVLLLLAGGVLAAWGSGIGSCRLADHGLTMLERSWGGTVAAVPSHRPEA